MAVLSAIDVEESRSPALHRQPAHDIEHLIAYAVLVIAIGFSAIFLVPEAMIRAQPLNDHILHIAAVQNAASALEHGHDPTDTWFARIGLGYPLFRHYQHLEYIPLAIIYVLSAHAISVQALIDWSTFLLLCLFPLSMYWAMRRFGFSPLAGAFAGLAAPLLSTNGLYGFDFASYVWRSYGLYTQLWGMFLLPLAVAYGYRLLRDGRGYFSATLLLSLTLLCHTVYGYVAVVGIGVIALLLLFNDRLIASGWNRVRVLALRLGLLFGLTALVCSYFLVPFMLDGTYMNRSVWEYSYKYNSFGADKILTWFGQGDLFDYGRLPILTFLVVFGFVVCIFRWREPLYRLPPFLFGVMLALYFGRPTWGRLLNLLPLSHDMQFHRLIGGVHLAGLLLIGVALAAPWPWLLRRTKIWPALGAGAVILVLLIPAFHERSNYLRSNADFVRQQQAVSAAAAPELDALVARLRSLPPGRVYAGFASNWGKDYRIGSVPMYAELQSANFDMVGYLYHALSLNSDIEVWFDDTKLYEYNLYNVRYVVAPAGQTFPSFVKPLAAFGRNVLYEVDTTGYFDLVQTPLTLTGKPDQLYAAGTSWLKGQEPALKQAPRVILNGDTPAGSDPMPLATAATTLARPIGSATAPRGAILSEQIDLNGRYAATVRADEPATVMVKITYDPGFRVTVDGRRVNPIMLMPSFIGVPVSSGTHQVVVNYAPGSLRHWLQLLGLLTLVGTVLVERKRAFLGRWWDGRPMNTNHHLNLVPLPARAGRRADVQPDLRDSERLNELTAIPLPSPPSSTTTPDKPLRRITRGVLVASPSSIQMVRATYPPENGVSLRLKLGIYLLFLSVYLFTGAGHFYSTDHVAVYLTTQSMVENHSLAIKPIARTVVGRGGHSYGRYGLLQSVVSIPLYIIGTTVNSTAPQLHTLFAGPDLGDWGGTVPIFFVSLLNAFVTPFTCVLFFLFALRLGFSRAISFGMTLLFGFSTLTWTYARDYFQHPLETLFLFLCAYLLFSRRDHLLPGAAFWAGVPFGLAVLTRLNIAIVLPFFALYVFLLADRSGVALGERRSTVSLGRLSLRYEPKSSGRPLAWWFSPNSLRLMAAFLAAPIVSIVLYLCLNYYRFGTVRDPAVHNILGGSADIFIGLYGNLLSPGRSIFLYSPPLILGLLGFREFRRRYRAESVLFAGIALSYLLLYSIPLDWDGGWSWGPRYLLATVPFLLLPLGYFLTSRRRIAIAAVFGLFGAAIQLLGIIINYSYVYWDWINMKLVPSTAYLFDPSISAIPESFRDLMAGRHADMWLLWAYHQSGLAALVGMLMISFGILTVALLLITDNWEAPGLAAETRREQSSESRNNQSPILG